MIPAAIEAWSNLTLTSSLLRLLQSLRGMSLQGPWKGDSATPNILPMDKKPPSLEIKTFHFTWRDILNLNTYEAFPSGSDGKESACNAEDTCSIPESGRSPGEGNGNPFQYSCLENPMDRGAWQATGHGVTKSQIQLSN